MVSSLEVPVRAQRAELTLPATGSVKRTKVAFPLVYTGSAPQKVLAFVAAAAGESVVVELTYADRPTDPYKATVKLTGARIEIPKAEGSGKVAVVLQLVLSREDTREPRELLEFLLDAAHAQALELDLKAKVLQESLPFQKDGDGEASAELFKPVFAGNSRLGRAAGTKKRPKGSSPSP